MTEKISMADYDSIEKRSGICGIGNRFLEDKFFLSKYMTSYLFVDTLITIVIDENITAHTMTGSELLGHFQMFYCRDWHKEEDGIVAIL
jgi:hypothetical protein